LLQPFYNKCIAVCQNYYTVPQSFFLIIYLTLHNKKGKSFALSFQNFVLVFQVEKVARFSRVSLRKMFVP